jgi:arylsulfatase A-like enzyme
MRVFQFVFITWCLGILAVQTSAEQKLPNILWITSEDNGPELGCYGDTYAKSPNLDGLAAKGMMYLNCWSTAPVCAPARTTLISGLYPPSTGAEHMRSNTQLPSRFKMYPQYLRAAGYYCTNNSKEDFNLAKPGQVWDVGGRQSHWKNRPEGKPFFAIFNHTISHESQIRNAIPTANVIHDPKRVRVPAYHPDTPEVRKDWAQYYDRITMMDARAGQNLKELAEAGLAEDTIIFYYGDHGSGMPRSKRWPYNSGLRVPLILYVPEKWRHLAPKDYKPGGKTDRLVGFIDFAPTLLSIAGIKPPKHLQGYSFMGKYAAPEQPYIYGFRGRMDERYDMVRVVRDKRYIYIRNYMPHKIYGQYISYMFKTPTTQVWHDLYHAGKLNAAQSKFWQTKPSEELYDLASDRDEVNNLADSKKHADILKRLRNAQQALAVKIRDVGFLPEGEIHSRSGDGAPYDMGHNDKAYPMERVMNAAEIASMKSEPAGKELAKLITDKDSAVRYWAAMGYLIRGEKAVAAGREQLLEALNDKSTAVVCVAAEALGRYGKGKDQSTAIDTLVKHADVSKNSVFTSMLALNALDYVDDNAKRHIATIKALPTKGKITPARMGNYVPNLIGKTTADLGVKVESKPKRPRKNRK